jgi:hypothetical protein
VQLAREDSNQKGGEHMDNRQERRPGIRRWRFGVASLVVLLAVGLSASAAIAGSGTSASDQYDHATAIVKAAKSAKTPTAASTDVSAAHGLPFTGMSLVSVVIVGGALVGIGFALRRRDKHTES